MPKADQGGIVRISRTMGVQFTQQEFVTGKTGPGADQLQTFEDGEADITRVLVANTTLYFFAVHMSVRDYPRLNVTVSRFENSTVSSADGFGLNA